MQSVAVGLRSLVADHKLFAETRDRTGDLQIFSLTLSQLSYRGMFAWRVPMIFSKPDPWAGWQVPSETAKVASCEDGSTRNN